MPGFQYSRLADDIESQIQKGIYGVGDKLPSLRALHARTGLSISTAYHAYMELEARGLVETREKSGFYVRPPLDGLMPLPATKGRVSRPKKVSINILASLIGDTAEGADCLPFGLAIPAPELFPQRQLKQAIKSILTSYTDSVGLYNPVAGDAGLKRQIVKRSGDQAPGLKESDIVLTNGCVDAIQLALRTVAAPGDTILLESPVYTVYLQLIEDLHMLALEIPSHPLTGMDLEAAAVAVKKNKVSACLLNANFQNPLGYKMPDASKQEFVRMMSDRNIPIIEDNIFEELYFGKVRPRTMKSFDTSGQVLLCSSFSKSLCPDLRVGWIVPGAYREKLMRMKFNSSVASPRLNQMVVAEFISGPQYDRHLKRLRNSLRNQAGSLVSAVAKHFPEGSRVSAPRGGLVLWVEMDRKVDGLELFHAAIREKIYILPGQACTSTGKYRNCIRLNFGHPWNESMENGIRRLGRLVSTMS